MAPGRSAARTGARAPVARPLLVLVAAAAAALLLAARPSAAGQAPFVVLTVGGAAYNLSYARLRYDLQSALVEGCGGRDVGPAGAPACSASKLCLKPRPSTVGTLQ